MALLMLAVMFSVMACVGVVLVCGDPESSDPVGIANNFLTGVLPDLVTTIMTKLHLLWVLRLLSYIKYLFCGRRNPIVQIMYLVLVVGGFGVFLYEAYPRIPNMYMGGYHKINGFFVVASCLITFIGASFVSPGVVKKETVDELSVFPYDGVLYREATCKTCQTPKVPRSKHCRVCNHCVAKFDHHCIWLNQCVGERNYRWFLSYLITHAILLVYGATALVGILLTEITEKRLWSATFVQKGTNTRVQATYAVVFQYLMYYNTAIVGLLLLTSVMGVILIGFSVYHLYLAASNTTTNETFKWRNIAYAVEHRREDEAANGVPENERFQMPVNVYDKGWKQNLLEVFFPMSLRPRGPTGPKDASKGKRAARTPGSAKGSRKKTN